MTSYTKLQIKQLSNTGELLNCINCFAGQITVMRAVSPTLLRPYQRALAGIPSGEKFVVSLDGSPFESDQHTLIGFGEQTALHTATPVREMLEEAGVPSGSLTALLMSFGLEHVTDAPFNSLTSCEQRRVSILAATYEVDKVLVLNNPFEPIASQWRERFAEHITSVARNQKYIVVVPSLTCRPDHWIDNEVVARMQVGENIQKTIGFGSGTSDVNALVHQVREMMKNDPSNAHAMPAQDTPPPTPGVAESTVQSAAIPKPVQGKDTGIENLLVGAMQSMDSVAGRLSQRLVAPNVKQRRLKMAVPILAVALLAIVFAFRGDSESTKVAKNITPPTVETNTAPSSGVKNVKPAKNRTNNSTIAAVKNRQPTARPDFPIQESRQPPTPPSNTQRPKIRKPGIHRAKMLLDEYPSPIRNAILASFKGSSSPVEITKTRSRASTGSSLKSTSPGTTNRRPTKQKKNPAAMELLTLLQGASGSGEGIKSENPNSSASGNSSGGDEQDKRELIRKKFLEAIEKAAERRNKG